MIYNEDTYYYGYHRTVRELGAVPALVFNTICGLIRENGIGEISNNTLMELIGINSRHTLTDSINKIIEAGYLEKKSGDGRGNKCIYYITEKGAKNAPFMDDKGGKICTKRGQKMHKKGAENAPINTELNKELKESGGDTREAQSHTLSVTTTKDFNFMEDFLEFWKLYPGDPEWSHEKDNCARFWDSASMPDEWKQKLLEQLRKGLRYRHRDHDNPIWYLRNYKGETVTGELPYYHQGTAKFAKFIAKAEADGTPVVIMRYPVEADGTGKLAYCLQSDQQTMEAAGAIFLTNYNLRHK